MILSINIYNPGKYNDKQNERVVCSHQIFRCLRETHPCLEHALKGRELDINRYGTFSIQDFMRLYDKHPELFEQLMPLYTP